MVSSKELVKKAIEFKYPERIPYNFDSNRTPAIDHKYGDDFVWVFVDANANFLSKINTETEYESEWGIIYKRLGNTFGEAKVYPLDEIGKVDSYIIPDFAAKDRYKSIEKVANENPDKYVMGMFPHFLFLHMLDLFGFENLMIELMDNRVKVEYIADLLTESCLNVVDCMAQRGVDGMISIEDLGVQDRLIINPDMWREIFKPRYKKIIDRLHKNKMHFFIHSCGYIFDIIEDFIEIGVDVLQIDQQDNMGIDKLGEKYAGRICFFCPVDIQTTLATGSFEEIESKALHLLKALGNKSGGFMAKTYPQPKAINIPEENIAFMCDVFKSSTKQ